MSASVARPFEFVNHGGRHADVGDDHIAGQHFAGRQHERELRRGDRDGQRRIDDGSGRFR